MPRTPCTTVLYCTTEDGAISSINAITCPVLACKRQREVHSTKAHASQRPTPSSHTVAQVYILQARTFVYGQTKPSNWTRNSTSTSAAQAHVKQQTIKPHTTSLTFGTVRSIRCEEGHEAQAALRRTGRRRTQYCTASALLQQTLSRMSLRLNTLPMSPLFVYED